MSSDTAARAREQRIAEIRERESKATKGPCEVKPTYPNEYFIIAADGYTVARIFGRAKGMGGEVDDCAENYANAEFYAHTRADIPFLLEQLTFHPGETETEWGCGHGKWDCKGDCVTCLTGAIDYMGKELSKIRQSQTTAEGGGARGLATPSSAAPIEEVAREIFLAIDRETAKLANPYCTYTPPEQAVVEKLMEAIANVLRQHGYGTQGQGVGPRCQCGGAVSAFASSSGMKGVPAKVLISCNSCGKQDEFSNFFSPVPSPESATKEGK